MLRCWSHGARPQWGQPATAKLPPSHRPATNKPPPSHQQANHQLTSPSSQGAENTSLRPARAVPLGPKGKATSAQAVGRGGLGERRSGHVPRHPGQSRPRQGLLDAHFLLPPNSGTFPRTVAIGVLWTPVSAFGTVMVPGGACPPARLRPVVPGHHGPSSQQGRHRPGTATVVLPWGSVPMGALP